MACVPYRQVLADRLAISQIKCELEDLCLKYLEPDFYEYLTTNIDERLKEGEGFVEKVVSEVNEMLKESKIVGEVIAHFRKQKGVSQEVLSGFADIGRSHLSAIERGERKPTLETLYRICTALEIKMSTVILKLEEDLD